MDNIKLPCAYNLLIDGQKVTGQGAQLSIVNPATGQLITHVAAASLEQVHGAVNAAKNAFWHWRKTTPAERSDLLLQFSDLLKKEQSTLAYLESLNCGKPYRQMVEDELPATIDCLKFFAGAARTMTTPAAGTYLPGTTSLVCRDPVGVVSAIIPWNYPLMMAVWKIAPAIAGGNSLVLKTSEITPLSMLFLVDALCDLFPAGVLNILTGEGDTVGKALCSSPAVSMVSLTGDPLTGSSVLQSVSDSIKRTHLELGGKAPVIAFADANYDELLHTLESYCCYNAGQDCTAPCLVYAHHHIYDRLLADLAMRLSKLKLPLLPPEHPDCVFSPVISETQQNRVHEYVQRAQNQAGNQIVCGGQKISAPGFYYEPTVVSCVDYQTEIVQAEVFGPVVAVVPFRDVTEVVDKANSSTYGLASGVWTQNIDCALHVARSLQFGCTWVNSYFLFANEMPHGGFKRSGYGKDLSILSLEDYTVARHLLIKHDF